MHPGRALAGALLPQAGVIDMVGGAHKLARMIRLFVILLSTLALAFSPVAANAAASAQTMAGCDMKDHMPAKPANHSKMDCCTPACQATSSAVLTFEGDAAGTIGIRSSALLSVAAVKELGSAISSGLDPPPRL